MSININSIRGKKLELLAFLDFHQPQIVVIQETKIDSSISTSELFPESCPYNVYRKDRTLDGGGVMLLIHKDISHMPITTVGNQNGSFRRKYAFPVPFGGKNGSSRRKMMGEKFETDDKSHTDM